MATAALFWLLLPFCFLAAAMAFVITYGEMRHHYAGRKQPLREAVRAALVTLIVFLTLSWVIAVVVPGRI